MSHVVAYLCDYKRHIVREDKAIGIILTEDLFDKLHSYPTIMNPEKAFCHYCLDCYSTHVLRAANKLCNRKKEGEDVYKLKIKELSYGLRSVAVKNFRDRK